LEQIRVVILLVVWVSLVEDMRIRNYYMVICVELVNLLLESKDKKTNKILILGPPKKLIFIKHKSYIFTQKKLLYNKTCFKPYLLLYQDALINFDVSKKKKTLLIIKS
jgi:hypothetical protein